MPEALVTGANGFVGSHVCEALITAGYSVRALVRKSSDLTNLQGVPVQLAYGDLSDPQSLVAVVEGIDTVINNAGLTKTNNPRDFHTVNALGTENILRATAEHNPGLKRFVQISSTAACGPSATNAPIDELHPPAPLTHYGRSKLDGERAVLSYSEKLPVVILRPSAIYGPRDKEMLLFFKCVKMGIKPAFGYSQNHINFTYVKDLAKAIVPVIESEILSGSIYFVVENRSYCYSEAGDIIAGLLNRKAHNLYVPENVVALAGRVSEKIAKLRHKPSIFTREKALEISRKYWLFDPSKAERELGFVAATDFAAGAAETVAWYKEKGWL
jgi:nucleoside-diphosphate-sugar epimerase